MKPLAVPRFPGCSPSRAIAPSTACAPAAAATNCSSTPSDLGLDENTSGPAANLAASTSEHARTLRAAVAALPADQQRALKLAFFSGLTQEEIAARLETPLGTIKARIRRGLLKLRDQLANRL